MLFSNVQWRDVAYKPYCLTQGLTCAQSPYHRVHCSLLRDALYFSPIIHWLFHKRGSSCSLIEKSNAVSMSPEILLRIMWTKYHG